MNDIGRAKRNLASDIGRWGIVPEWLLDSNVSDRAIRLYATLGAKYVDRSTGEAFPSRRTLASDVHVALAKTIDAALGELEDIGAVIINRRHDAKGVPTSNQYKLRYARSIAGVTGGIVAAQSVYRPSIGPLVVPGEGLEIVPQEGHDPQSVLPESLNQNSSALARLPPPEPLKPFRPSGTS